MNIKIDVHNNLAKVHLREIKMETVILMMKKKGKKICLDSVLVK